MGKGKGWFGLRREGSSGHGQVKSRAVCWHGCTVCLLVCVWYMRCRCWPVGALRERTMLTLLYVCDCCKQATPQFPNDPDDEQLCGVGIVLYKAPDNSLFVKVRTTCRARVCARV
jgi:hypothetical protein